MRFSHLFSQFKLQMFCNSSKQRIFPISGRSFLTFFFIFLKSFEKINNVTNLFISRNLIPNLFKMLSIILTGYNCMIIDNIFNFSWHIVWIIKLDLFIRSVKLFITTQIINELFNIYWLGMFSQERFEYLLLVSLHKIYYKIFLMIQG